LEFIDFDHKKEKYDKDSEDENTKKIIDIDQIITSKEASMNLMSEQGMILFKDFDNTVSQPVDYKLDTFITS
jgi:hypothetical protein